MRYRRLRIVSLAAALAVPVGARTQSGTAALLAPAQAAAVAPVEVTTTLSRTAVWVGDRIIYTVKLHSLPGFDIVLEDLGQDRLRVDGGEVLSVEEGENDEPLGDRAVRRVRYTVVANRTDVPTLRVAALVVRYFERRADEATHGAPAGQVIVPAAVVPIRSTLPEGGIVAGPRTPTELRLTPRLLQLMRPIGLTLVVLTILPVVLAILRAGPRARAGWRRIHALRERRRRRQAFAEVRDLSPSSESDRIAAFGRLDAFVRDHLEENAAVPALALTPAELRQALSARGTAFEPEGVEQLLEACERARYAPAPPSDREWTDAIRDAEQILHHGRR